MRENNMHATNTLLGKRNIIREGLTLSTDVVTAKQTDEIKVFTFSANSKPTTHKDASLKY